MKILLLLPSYAIENQLWMLQYPFFCSFKFLLRVTLQVALILNKKGPIAREHVKNVKIAMTLCNEGEEFKPIRTPNAY